MPSAPPTVAAPPAAPVARPPSLAPWIFWVGGWACVLWALGVALRWGGWDGAVFLGVNASLCGPDRWCAGLWAGLSFMGLGASAVVLLLALDRQRQQAVATALVCVPLAWAVTHWAKVWLAWPRPSAVLPAGAVQTLGEPLVFVGSMPSGHAVAAFTLAWVLHATLARAWHSRLVVWGVAVAVAVSRVAVGAHWPSDVAVGAGLGLVLGAVGWAVAQRLGADGRWADSLGRGRWALSLGALECVLGLWLVVGASAGPLAEPMRWALGGLAGASALGRWHALWRARDSAPARSPADTHGSRVGASLAGFVGPVVVAGLLCSALMSDASWQRLGPALRGVPLWLWAAAVGGLWGSYALRAERMRREWSGWLLGPGRSAQGVPAPTWAECLAIFLAHNAALVVLPLRAGELGYPWLLHQRWGVPLAESLRSLLWLRFQDAVVLAMAAGVLMLPLGWPARLGVLALAVVVALWGVPLLIRWLAGRVAKGQVLLQALHEHARDRTGWLLCAANWVLKLAVLGGLLAWLAGLDAGAGWRGAVGGELAAALPLQAPAGLGTYEAGIWGAVALNQLPPAGLVAAALAVHGVSLLCALMSFALFRAWPLPERAMAPLNPESSS